MQRTAFFEFISPWGKMLLLLGLVILFSIITAFGGLLIGKIYLETDISSLATMLANPQGEKVIAFTKVFQLLNQVGVFILPVMLFAFLVSKSSISYLKLSKTPLAVSVMIAAIIVFTILPFLNYISQLNMEMSFPESLKWLEEWMTAKEEQAQTLTRAFLKADTISGLLINIFIIALIPAIGEELLFRGALLRLFGEIFKNVHLAVFVSAILFSLFHLQFFGFFPRLLLGIILGYLFVFTQNLWVPMVFHFVNNAASVIVYFLHENNMTSINVDDFGSSNNLVYIIGSLLITIWLIIMLRQKESYLL
jgi:membrane protease YdiL (CAAX protease family)